MSVAEIITPTQPDFRYRHLSDVTSTLCGLWRRRLYTDLTLVANGKNVRCHRVVLASASPYFHSRLFNGKKESGTDKIFISDVPRDILSDVLDFVYSGECRLDAKNAEELLRAAAIFELGVLRDMCDDFLKDVVHEKNALKLYKMARATKSPRMEEKAREVIFSNFQTLSHTKLFKQLSHRELISIIRRDDPATSSPDLMTPTPDLVTPTPDPVTSSPSGSVTTPRDRVMSALDLLAPIDFEKKQLSSVSSTDDGMTPREVSMTIDMMAPPNDNARSPSSDAGTMETTTSSNKGSGRRVAFASRRSSTGDMERIEESDEGTSGNADDEGTSGDDSMTPRNKMAAPSEDVICGAVLAWIKVDAARRKHVLSRILKHVRLVEVERETLVNLADNEPVVADDEVSFQMISDAITLKDKLAAASQEANAAEQEEQQQQQQQQPQEELKPDDVLVMIGGAEEHGSRFRSRQRVHAFNLNLRKWFPLTPLPLGCDSGTAYCVRGNDIFVSGAGETRQGLVRYHAATNAWKVLAPMLVGRRGHCIVAAGPYLYVVGGVMEGQGTASNVSSAYGSLSPRVTDPHITTTIERYDLRSNSWQTVGSLAEPVWGASAVAFKDKIHVFGGFHSKDKPTAVVQTFSPGSGSSIVSSQLPFPLALSRAVVVNSNSNNKNKNGSGSETVYILGPSGNVLSTRDCWRFKVAAAIPDFQRALFGLAGDGSRLFVAGGRYGDRVHREVLMMDVQHGTMVVLPQHLPQPLWGGAFVKIAMDRDHMVKPGSQESQY